MMKSGVLYGPGEKRTVRVGRTRELLRKTAWFLRTFGKWSWIGAIIAAVYLAGPVVREEIRFLFLRTPTGRIVEKAKNTPVGPLIVDTSRELVVDWIVPDKEYSIYIPKIGAKSRVVSNVDPWTAESYQEALKEGVAAARGLANPGENGTIYLFAHSVGSRADFARYNAIFYLLHKLETGDAIEIVYKNRLFKYQMIERKIIDARDLTYFEKNFTDEKLVLQTCYPPGTTWKRLIVLGKRVS